MGITAIPTLIPTRNCIITDSSDMHCEGIINLQRRKIPGWVIFSFLSVLYFLLIFSPYPFFCPFPFPSLRQSKAAPLNPAEFPIFWYI